MLKASLAEFIINQNTQNEAVKKAAEKRVEKRKKINKLRSEINNNINNIAGIRKNIIRNEEEIEELQKRKKESIKIIVKHTYMRKEKRIIKNRKFQNEVDTAHADIKIYNAGIISRRQHIADYKKEIFDINNTIRKLKLEINKVMSSQ